MTKKVFQTLIIPDVPGVYFFLGKQKKILYIGKATSLKTRIASYFDQNLRDKRSELIEKMIHEAVTVEWTTTESVLEALLLEVNLIRTHKPYYNTRSKDDKSYNHVVITRDDYPRVLVVRGKDLQRNENQQKYTHIFGPFPNGIEFRNALKILKKLFKVYDIQDVNIEKPHSKVARGKIDFNRQIGLFPENISKDEYAKNIKHILLFFQGKKKQLISDLEREMMRYAKMEAFEKAQHVKRQLHALRHIQDVALIRDDVRQYTDNSSFRIEGYDVAHHGGKQTVGVCVVVIGDQVRNDLYRKFFIAEAAQPDDPASLVHILKRRLKHAEWLLPNLIVVDGNEIQKKAAEKVLKEMGLMIPVVGVVKDEHHKPKSIVGLTTLIKTHKNSILLANAEAHRFAITYHTKRKNLSFLA